MTHERRRLHMLEDRRIAILLEIGDINREHDERLSRLEAEYARLSEEYYGMRLERIARRERG
jgi:hypothetical protein